MFILEQPLLTIFELSNAADFINCWSQFYVDNVKVYNGTEPISYIQELNIGHRLTPENVKRLLRWKDRRYLTAESYGGTPEDSLPSFSKFLEAYCPE